MTFFPEYQETVTAARMPSDASVGIVKRNFFLGSSGGYRKNDVFVQERVCKYLLDIRELY